MQKQLYTPEGEAPDAVPWSVYPRPQLRRDSFLNLNGDWQFQICSEPAPPETYPHTVRVPFPPESRLSGLQMQPPPGSYLFYARKLRLPDSFQQGRILLHIGAADQITDVYVNQLHIGAHIGGYEAMTFDITDALRLDNDLVIRVRDDLRDTALPYGKQTLKRGGQTDVDSRHIYFNQ